MYTHPLARIRRGDPELYRGLILDAVRASTTMRQAAELLGYVTRTLFDVIIEERLEEQVLAIRGGHSPFAKKPRSQEELEQAIQVAGGKIRRAAHLLGLSRDRVYRRINALDLWPVVDSARQSRRARGLVGAAQKELGHG